MFTMFWPGGVGRGRRTDLAVQVNCHVLAGVEQAVAVGVAGVVTGGRHRVGRPALVVGHRHVTSGVLPGLVTYEVDVTVAGGSRSPRTSVGVLTLVSAMSGA